MAALKESGQLENTLVVYTADQGFAMGEHGLRMKIAPYDANYRSPLIVCHARDASGRRSLPAAAQRPGPGRHLLRVRRGRAAVDMHGRDMTPLLKNPDSGLAAPVLYEHTGHDYGSDVSAS